MFSKKSLVLCVASIASTMSVAATLDQAAQLGNELTCWGAPKAGNASGTIPAWTGTPKAPTTFHPGSGRYPNPFVNEKPLYTITAANMGQYADKLSEIQKELLKRYPAYRIDVFPTHRTFDQPKIQCDAARKNMVSAKTEAGGASLVGAFGATPFPLPKTGYEVMWNHLLAWRGEAYTAKYQNWYVDSTGRQVMAGASTNQVIGPYFMKGKSSEWLKSENDNVYFGALITVTGPARSVGEGSLTTYNLTPSEKSDKSWGYQPGQRRVRLQPDSFYDFPIASHGGAIVFDDVQVFYGALDRFDFKLVGKKEMLIPYNGYDYLFAPTDKLLQKNFLNPDLMRWELHRVWVVEATLKPGFRHIYSKRVFYFDEDNAGAGMSDQYDMSGKLFRGVASTSAQLYDLEFPYSSSYFAYDLSSNSYATAGRLTAEGMVKSQEPDLKKFTPQALQSSLQR